MKIRMSRLRQILEQETRLARIEEAEGDIYEGEVVDFPGEPKLPWEFGPEGYLKRPELTQKMSDLEYGSDSAPEDILAIALSNRAEEMMGYKQTVDPAPFNDLAMRLYRDYVVGMAGNVEQNLHDITSRIDAGGYFDEDIEDVMDNMQMQTTQGLASQQDPDEIADMDLDFEKYLQGIESGKVAELDPYDDLAENNLNEGIMVSLSGIGENMKRRDTMADRWSRIAGLDNLNEQVLDEADDNKKAKEDEAVMKDFIQAAEKIWNKQVPRDKKFKKLSNQEQKAAIDKATSDVATYMSRLSGTERDIGKGLEKLSEPDKRARLTFRRSLLTVRLGELKKAANDLAGSSEVMPGRQAGLSGRGLTQADLDDMDKDDGLTDDFDSDAAGQAILIPTGDASTGMTGAKRARVSQTPTDDSDEMGVADTEGNTYSYKKIMADLLDGKKVLKVGSGGTKAKNSKDLSARQTWAQVKVIQSLLKDAGYASFNPTGYYGNLTDKAVRKMQAALKLEVDGDVGRQTASAFDPRIDGSKIPVTGAKVDAAIKDATSEADVVAEGVLERMIREEMSRLIRR